MNYEKYKQTALIDCENRSLLIKEIEKKLTEAKEELDIESEIYLPIEEDFERRTGARKDPGYCGAYDFFEGELENFKMVQSIYMSVKSKFESLEWQLKKLNFLQEIKATKETEEKLNEIINFVHSKQ